MKYILILLSLVAFFVPIPAVADQLSEDEAWTFLYEFPLSFRGDSAVSDGSYRITTGDAPILSPGSWHLVILDGAGAELTRYAFDPTSPTLRDTGSLVVPAEHRGATAAIINSDESRTATIDVRESRVCNDDHVCAIDAGERYGNCPTDCGGGGLSGSIAGTQTAAIGQQSGMGAWSGGLLRRLSLGVAGILLLVGVARVLDSRRRS